MNTFLITLLDESTTRRFVLMATLAMAFSMTVILATIGLMDGFDLTLKEALRKFQGDFQLLSKKGLRPLEEEKSLMEQGEVTSILQTEAFMMAGEKGQGVLLRGVEGKSFFNVTGLRWQLPLEGVVIGQALAEDWGLRVGDFVVLAFAKNNVKKSAGMQTFLRRVPIQAIVDHQIYEKDHRLAYVDRNLLGDWLGVKDRFNLVLMNRKLGPDQELQETWGETYKVRVFWQEYSSLLEAVKVEKMSIVLVLQMIVVVAAFNLSAFLIYLSETKKAAFFLYQSLGLSKKQLFKNLLILLLGVWLASSVLAFVGVSFFAKLLMWIPYFKKTAAIYNLGHFSLSISLKNYFLVYFSALLWVLGVTFLSMRKFLKHSPVQGLRELSY